jgi:hypothetical protein
LITIEYQEMAGSLVHRENEGAKIGFIPSCWKVLEQSLEKEGALENQKAGGKKKAENPSHHPVSEAGPGVSFCE